MKYQIYKPNQKNSGCAMSFSIGKGKDGSPSLYINSVLQSGWNESTKTGSFGANAKDPNKSGNFKMNANEAGEMLSSLKTRIPVVFFHKFNNDTTIIKFSPWDKNRVIKGQNGDETYKSPAFGLSISKNSSVNFKIALEAGECEVLAVLLSKFISLDLEYQAEKNQSEQRKPEQNQQNTQPASVDTEEDDVPF